MKESAHLLNFIFPEKKIRSFLDEAAFPSSLRTRLRLLLSKSGEFTSESTPCEQFNDFKLCLSAEPVDSSSKFLFHKTTARGAYEEKLRLANQENFYDCIFLNERGEVTEGARTNLYIEKHGVLFTPFRSSGLLGGIIRQKLLESGRAREDNIYLSDISNNRIMISNSLIGLKEASIVLQKKV